VAEGRRKYITEWTVGITVSAAVVGRPQDLKQNKMPQMDDPCHLYFVTQRPRISIDPSSVVITDDQFYCVLRLQRGGSWDEFPLRSPHRLGPGPLRWVADWPYEDFAIKDVEGRTISKGVVANLHVWIDDWPPAAKEHDIVYIGQAFGQAGERTAWDRLKKHETVQRILAETTPDKQVWLTLAAITDENLFPEIDPRGPTEKSSAEDDDHISLVVNYFESGSFREKEAVALAEAGLIRYFQPEYNDRMKYSFPARKQVPLESVRRLDFHGLIVELQSEAVDALYGSRAQKRAWVHFAGFAIHEDKERAGTISLAAANWSPKWMKP
jgi:hypothetical protein